MAEPGSENLTPEAKKAINSYLYKTVGRIASIVGIGSLLALWALLVTVPKNVAASAINNAEDELNRSGGTLDKFRDDLLLSQDDLDDLKRDVEALQGSIDAIKSYNLDEINAKATQLNVALSSLNPEQLDALNTIVGSQSRITDLQTQVSSLQTQLDLGTDLIIANYATCPEGWRFLATIGVIVFNEQLKDTKPYLNAGGVYNEEWSWDHPALCKKIE